MIIRIPGHVAQVFVKIFNERLNIPHLSLRTGYFICHSLKRIVVIEIPS